MVTEHKQTASASLNLMILSVDAIRLVLLFFCDFLKNIDFFGKLC